MKYSEFEKENTDLENILNILYRSGLKCGLLIIGSKSTVKGCKLNKSCRPLYSAFYLSTVS